jgi:hypothetical protein
MITLSETIEGELWSVIDLSSLENNGCIVDLGCLSWNWSNSLIGRKRIIGVDPIEDFIPENVEFFKGVIGPFNGKIKMSVNQNNNCVSSISNNDIGDEFEMLSLKNFCKKFDINLVSILKVNIEGSEYPFLHSLDKEDFKKINQIVISFHDWLDPNLEYLTQSSLYLLKQNGYTIISTFKHLGWYLCTKNI